MSTENGVERRRVARKHIERLRDRLHYLQDRTAEAIDEGDKPNPHWAPEIEALQWAIPILEAEWDQLNRIHQNVQRVESRFKSIEKRGIEEDPHSAPQWDIPVS